MNMVQVAINVHGSPSESDHTWAELVLKIFKVRHEERLGVGTNLVDDSVVLSEDELKLILVGLELVFLEQNNLGTLWDVNGSDT